MIGAEVVENALPAAFVLTVTNNFGLTSSQAITSWRLRMRDLKQRRFGEGVFLIAFGACIPLANWLNENLGTMCVPQGPCLIPVAPGVVAPSREVTVGLALVVCDLVQRRLGLAWSVGAIGIGGVLSATFPPASLVVASVTAFLLSEVADLRVYSQLQRRQ